LLTPPPWRGFYGKAVTCGDFVGRGLPPDFRAWWDAFLQAMVSDSKAALGPAWFDTWMQAPVWHFCLAAGVAGPRQVRGVLIPSADRVGRAFPFSVLAEAAAGGEALKSWCLTAEALALSAVEDGFRPDHVQLPAVPDEEALGLGMTKWCRLEATEAIGAGMPKASGLVGKEGLLF